jgi:hypothetical protein
LGLTHNRFSKQSILVFDCSGAVNVFLASPWVPPEWVKAHGLEPRTILSLPVVSGSTLSAGACAHAETVLLQAESQAHGAFVFTTHCDQLRRAYDALISGASTRAFLFNLPATFESRAVHTLFHQELERLKRWLLEMGGREPGRETLMEILQDYEMSRERLATAGSWCSGRPYAEALLQFYSAGTTALPEPVGEARTAQPTLIPLALVGGPFTLPYWPLLDEIAKSGGTVVLNATDYGERGLGRTGTNTLGTWAAANRDPEALSRLFLGRMVDVFQRPNDRLYEWLGERIQQRRVQGIVLWHFIGCDLWRGELRTLEDRFQIPVLLLENDGTGDGSVRTSTRIQAFLESLRHRQGFS